MRAFCRHWVLLYGPHFSGSKKILPADNTRAVGKMSGKEAKRERNSFFFFPPELFLKLKKIISGN